MHPLLLQYIYAMEQVVLVDENDQVLGQMEKIEAHRKGRLHRAFSVFLFNTQGEMLLQQRAASKYHSPLLWTNSCCSHPRINESYLEAAKRRLVEELGVSCELEAKFHFIYKTQFDNELYEHELDHVFIGSYAGEIPFNPEEVAAVRWISTEDLKTEINNYPDRFTVWFKIIFNEYLDRL